MAGRAVALGLSDRVVGAWLRMLVLQRIHAHSHAQQCLSVFPVAHDAKTAQQREKRPRSMVGWQKRRVRPAWRESVCAVRFSEADQGRHIEMMDWYTTHRGRR